MSEVAERRKEYATEFGADIILDPSKEDVVARVKELTDNVGVAVVYDCAGESVFFVLFPGQSHNLAAVDKCGCWLLIADYILLLD